MSTQASPTKLDVYLNAVNAAAQTLDISGHLPLQEKTLDLFKASGFDPANSQFWFDQFSQARNLQGALRIQPAVQPPIPAPAEAPKT